VVCEDRLIVCSHIPCDVAVLKAPRLLSPGMPSWFTTYVYDGSNGSTVSMRALHYARMRRYLNLQHMQRFASWRTTEWLRFRNNPQLKNTHRGRNLIHRGLDVFKFNSRLPDDTCLSLPRNAVILRQNGASWSASGGISYCFHFACVPRRCGRLALSGLS